MTRWLCALSAVACLHHTDAAEEPERPVAKVVKLLQDMGVQLRADLEADEGVHKTLDCWCTTNEREKTTSIEAGQSKIQELQAALEEAKAKVGGLKSQRDATLDEVNKDVSALDEAATLRMKESKRIHEEEMNLVEAVKACDQALVVLGKHNAALPQVRAVAEMLQQSKVLKLARRTASATEMLVLRNFFADLKGQRATSFLSAQSHAPESGQVFGILSQMKEDFANDLGELQAGEKQKAEGYAKLRSAKQEEIAAGRKLQADLDGQIAETKEKHAQAFQELEDTKKQLVLDTAFMQKLKAKCSVSDEEYAQRVKDRQAEIAAVEDTINILNADDAHATFGKAVNSPDSFVQLASESTSEERLNRVADLLQRAAASSGVPALSLLAMRAQLDTFAEVKAEIDKMVTELKKQQKDEVQQRDWCIAQMHENEGASQAGYDTKALLETKIADVKKTSEYLMKEMETATLAVAEMQAQMKRASENRQAENAQFQASVSDQRLAQMFLGKALVRMRKVYAMLQASSADALIPMGASKDDPGTGPAAFKKYEKHSGGSKIVRMIEEIIAESRKTEDDAMRAEDDDAAAYENLMKDSNKAIVTYGEKITNMKSSLAGAEEELSMSSSDLKATVGTLGDLHDELGNLHKSCDYVMENFDKRQAARAAELNSMTEAKAILSGMK